MHEGIERAVMEAIEDEVNGRLGDLRYALKDAIRGIYWPSYEKGKVTEKVLADLDKLVDAVFKTVHREGPGDETWPAFDEKLVRPILNAIQDELQLEKGKVRYT